jgi:hypothetical protein
MPGRDGIDLVQTAQAKSPDTRAILMSAFASARDSQAAMELGVVRVLCKPFSRAQLRQAIDEAVDSKTGFRGSIHGLSLVDMLQMLHFARRSITLSVAIGSRHGSIHLRGGEIIDADCGELSGEVALGVLLQTSSGSLSTSVLASRTTTIARDFQGLLLDALREGDERAAAGEEDLVFDLGEPDEARSRPSNSAHPRARSGVSSIPARPLNHWGPITADIARIAPECSAALFEPDAAHPVPLQNAHALSELAEPIGALAATVAKLAGEWTVLEYVGSRIGVGLVAASEGAVLLLVSELTGRYASCRFRSQVGRIAARMSSSPRT